MPKIKSFKRKSPSPAPVSNVSALMSTGTMRLPLHLQATTAETTTTLAPSRRGSYNDSCAGGGPENGSRRHQAYNYRQRLPYTARFQKLDTQPYIGS